MNASILTASQSKTFGPRHFSEGDRNYSITARVRYDDDCRNGHNTFSITGEIRRGANGGIESCGCLHDEIAKHFPELAPYIKWHLCSSDGPMHYVANTVYHADEHGPTHAWVYYTGENDPLGIGGAGERLVGYETAAVASKSVGREGYRVKWDQKTSKVANLDHARGSAIWPEATDDELRSGKHALTLMLNARLPQLMDDFRAAVESLGFTY